MSKSDHDSVEILGSPTCGLVGPFAFPFQWTFQRNRGGRKSSRKSMHRLTGIKGMPLFIEAAPPPVKCLKNMLQEFGAHVSSHLCEIDEDFFTLFAAYSTVLADADEVILDFTQAFKARACRRYGTWKLFNQQRSWFYKLFLELQRRAIANGRYFPPPTILRARVHRTNGVRIEIGFSGGFLPGNKLLALAFPSSGGGTVSTSFRPQPGVIVHADESIPTGQSLNEQIDRWATDFCRSGESIVFAGFIRGLSNYELHHVWHALAEGDELAVRIEGKGRFTDLYLVWERRILGRVARGEVEVALRNLREAKPLRVAIVRLHAFHEPSFRQIAYAMYRREPE